MHVRRLEESCPKLEWNQLTELLSTNHYGMVKGFLWHGEGDGEHHDAVDI